MHKSIQHAKWPLNLLIDLLPSNEANLIFEQLKVVIWKSVYLYKYLIVSSVKFYVFIHCEITTLFKIENSSMTLKVLSPTLCLRQPLLYFLSLWVSFVFSRISYKWNHIIHTLLCLACFAQCKAFDVHPCGVSLFLPGLTVGNTAQFVYPFTCCWIFELLPVFPIMNTAFVNIHVQLFFADICFYFSLVNT